MTRPKRPITNKGATTKGARGHAPKKMTAQGRGGMTRDTTKVVREPRPERPVERTEESDRRPSASTAARRYGSASATTGRATVSRSTSAGPKSGGRKTGEGRKLPPKPPRKAMPELKRVQLDAPPADTVFVDRDGERLTFSESNLRRVAAQILTEKRKAWRYRPFSFPIFSDKGNEQSFNFDFYIYDAEDSVIRLILVIPFESREVWDKVGRFKRQYPMYHYELWTPERLAQLSGPRGRLDF
ncbi:hypothetical protein [Deinococcus sp.]|uniref:hypothetical protein n=1 Tax=Deinococcus sp. TaxID=47478 RepID=UPI0025BCC14F|nr:hypothetical protein [Deinococcus sp.]